MLCAEWCCCGVYVWKYSDKMTGLDGIGRRWKQKRPASGLPQNRPKMYIWWSYAGSNRGPLACHASALPAELQPQIKIYLFSKTESQITGFLEDVNPFCLVEEVLLINPILALRFSELFLCYFCQSFHPAGDGTIFCNCHVDGGGISLANSGRFW